MSKLLQNVNQRTQLAGENRLELLLFRLQNGQLYGINVFKVKKIIPCPPLTQLPYHHPHVVGVANTMDGPLPILDLLSAIQSGKVTEPRKQSVIVCEYNRRMQGFLVDRIENIVNLQWSDILLPPKGIGHRHYLTSVTRVNNQLVEIIDVEKVISEVTPVPEQMNSKISEDFAALKESKVPRTVLVVDDSVVARNQIKRCLAEVELDSVLLKDGKQALDHLTEMVNEGKKPAEEYLMVISDIEMPEMDGYTFTRKVKEDPRMKDIYILLHTSLSGVFNKSMVTRVGADNFIAKFDADDLASSVLDHFRKRSSPS
ncbi:chemotaxis protein CheV [Marinospirillum alkaliphilum]|uniref:Two-component system, chemotaxis family, response regulator CheV n=1 Tax=Marinospirillum alkaliphilum DSM 21637 TaxID=1122209 RepID=A0A1K1YF19_9GAMM|nr:chemotaxis protein CheV [Marinospirillum alkaliphilum]SFX60511.1 two-component system, chemotaxis family, response regulator CheV [Marinospirillum alkaliphilum DSM 21637]